MRDDRLRLHDILGAADLIRNFTHEKTLRAVGPAGLGQVLKNSSAL